MALTVPPYFNIHDVVHSGNGRFNFILSSDSPQNRGLYVMASSNEQPVKAVDAPYDNVTAVWSPDGSGAIISHSRQSAAPFYGAVNEERLYTLQPYLGNAHTFQWRPKQ